MKLLFLRSTFSSCLALLLLFAACTKENQQRNLDTSKEIVSFSLKRGNGVAFDTSDLSVSLQGDTVTVVVPHNTDRNGLIPEITINGKSISPASGVPQNFTVPVTYTVTAEDGNMAVYVANVVLRDAGNLVYFGSSNKNFYALDASTGDARWIFHSTASFAYSSPTYAGGTVYVGGIDNYVYAFDAAMGTVKWKTLVASTGIEADAVVVNGSVYVGTNDDDLIALDAATGQEKWRFATGSNVSASATVGNEMVYFGSSDGVLYALDEATGSLVWSYSTGTMINQSGPALVGGVVYVGSRDTYLYAIDAMTGALKWRFYANGISLEQSSPTVVNGVVYIGSWYNINDFSKKGSLYAVDAATGRLVWEKLQNNGIGSSPCVSNGKLYITVDDLNLYALDASTGNTLWTKPILANGASPAVANGIVYVGGGGTGYFYAFDADSGAEKWKFPTPAGLMTSSPLIVTAGGTANYSGESGLLNLGLWLSSAFNAV